MAELKTQKNNADVNKFIESVENTTKRNDAKLLLKLMREITKETPKMWGTSIIGFGDYHYKSKAGTEGDWFKVGFSPRKQSMSIYLMVYGFAEVKDLLNKLGKHKLGKGCLYINKLKDTNIEVLKKLIKKSYSSYS